MAVGVELQFFHNVKRNSIITVKNVLYAVWGLFQYDATVPGGHGGGGEYEIQMGFGWTNGIIMELLKKYGDRLTVRDKFFESEYTQSYQSESRTSIAASTPTSSSVGQVMTLILALVATLAAGGIG